MAKPKAALEAKMKAAVDRAFEARGAGRDKLLKEVFFFSPNGEPSYKTVLLMRKLKKSGFFN